MLVRQLSPTNEVVSYDRTDAGGYPTDRFTECDFAVICVDTPARADGSVDVSNVEAALAQLPCENVLIRSTVPPGTTARLATSSGKNICFWPEYVGETAFAAASWEQFSAFEPFIVLGGEPESRRHFVDLLLPIWAAGAHLPVFEW